MNNKRDVVSEQLAIGTMCVVGASILAVPIFGFLPLLAVCAGFVAGAACFKATRAPKKKPQKARKCSR